jgi:murein DD-endopeptidase MepM/ murein hydrolase activator NlpD
VIIDYKTPKSAVSRRRSHARLTILLLLLVTLIAAVFLGDSRTPFTETEAYVGPAQIHAPPVPSMPETRREIIEGVVSPGDTITALLGNYFSTQEIHQLDRQSRNVFPLSGICAGQPYRLCLTDGAFEKFEYDINREHQLIISRGEEGFEISRVPILYEVEEELVRGVIRSNLFDAVTETGENPELAIALADIFAWDIDFIRDLRQDDAFQVLVEKRSREGNPAGYGKILAAEFTNQGKTHKAFLFQDGKNPPSYYDADGNSLRKAFLKAPLSFTRISSGFSMRRFHPVTKTWRAHPAIDYAAPTGTPIKTVGNGTITSIGYNKSNGNFIKITHQNGYETMYLHMNKFARGMRQGKKVTQGDVIGYVGSTGLATGPHLCFRMTRNGQPVNPQRIKAVAGEPISKESMAEFRTAIAPLKNLLSDSDLHARIISETQEDVETH